MKSVGLVIGRKENEKRRALLPDEMNEIENPEKIYVESGYGDVYGYTDSDYKRAGCNIANRTDVLLCDIVCDPKIGDSDYLGQLKKGQTVFGWIHAVQNKDIADKITGAGLTAYAWEDMFYCNRHIFYRNNELAGEAAVINAFECYGRMPYDTKAAVLGSGNTACGAIKILTMLGADVTCYNRKTENLFRDELKDFDVVVNCILWDTKRTDHIIYRSDLKNMKRNSMIIDVSCDKNGGIESSVPTTIKNPVYTVDGVLHYAVDHVPSIFHKNASKSISQAVAKYINMLIKEEKDDTLKNALIIEDGNIIDKRIIEFQSR